MDHHDNNNMHTVYVNYYYNVCGSWRNNVRSKVIQLNQLEVYQTLCIMESELDKEVLGNMMNSFIQCWEKQEPTFIKYFLENYFNRSDKKLLYVTYLL